MSEEEKIVFLKLRSEPFPQEIDNTKTARLELPEERLISSGTELKRRK